MLADRARGRRVSGFTLIELLVVLFTIGVLVALLLPAVQSAREAARRVQCASNLRQVGLAMHGYVASNGVFPAMANGMGFSPFAAILPYLEQAPLFDRLNFDLPYFVQENLTVCRTSPGVFLCPSDFAGARPPVSSWTNYAANAGWGRSAKGRFDGLFVEPVGVHLAPASLADGASATAMAAEWVHGTGVQDSYDRLSATYFRLEEDLWRPAAFEAAVRDCRTLDPASAVVWSSRGSSWMEGCLGFSAYSHDLAINGRSCVHGAIPWAFWTAGSRHGAGANVLFADGRASFLRESIDLRAWRAIGTRDGGEVHDDVSAR